MGFRTSRDWKVKGKDIREFDELSLAISHYCLHNIFGRQGSEYLVVIEQEHSPDIRLSASRNLSNTGKSQSRGEVKVNTDVWTFSCYIRS